MKNDRKWFKTSVNSKLEKNLLLNKLKRKNYNYSKRLKQTKNGISLKSYQRQEFSSVVWCLKRSFFVCIFIVNVLNCWITQPRLCCFGHHRYLRIAIWQQYDLNFKILFCYKKIFDWQLQLIKILTTFNFKYLILIYFINAALTA